MSLAIAIPFPDGLEGSTVGAGAIAGAALIALTITETITRKSDNFSHDEEVENCLEQFQNDVQAMDEETLKKVIASHCYESKKSAKRFRRFKPSSRN